MSKQIHDFGITTLEGIVERINDGPVQGFEHLTSEYLAASYAASAVLESDDMSADGELDAVEYHLELLAEAGAKFDAPQAERFALELIEVNAGPQEGFIESAGSRETSVELMQAILQVAGDDEAKAASIWEDGPNSEELVAIIEIVTKNGAHETTEFCWGAAGDNWANELGR